MPKNIKVGLIGYGMAGQVFHAPVITAVPGLQLTKIRETKPDNIQLAQARYPDAVIVPDSEAIISDQEIELVVIATPNSSHYSLAEKALLAGKHVVVDKPFTITAEEADKLIDLAARQNRVLTVHHNRRWDSNAKTLRKIIENQMLGRIIELEVHFDRYRPFLRAGAWREEDTPGSGILYDLGAHLIDEAQCLFGLPEAITADERIQRTNGKTIDNFTIVLDYPQLKVTLKAGMLVRQLGPVHVLHGENGTYIKYGLDVQEAALKEGLHPLHTPNWGKEPEANWGTINTEYQGQHLMGKIESEPGDYREFYVNVYQVLCGETELAVTPEQARQTIRIIELARQSSAEKRTLPFSR
ncbi:oxidoreductase [Adhaeribacter radiodurans]|uniref:Oxidoreductase n=1 Tax=Adhaeribacter radiodurans TaxID=2745197 RepID=A0A7L7L795_9BACT|nr:oxidoreductase [Adhaeribacter radiodurans]QMU28624.1 oxidoreductase [Adhaeribacter radiodurans]